MWCIGIIIAFILPNVLVVENRILPIYYETESPVTEDVMTAADIPDDESSNEKVILTTVAHRDNDGIGHKINEKIHDKYKKPCAIVVLSNVQNPTMQSLLRKYRYDSNGILIPGSVKYFIKLPQGLKSPSILVPLNDKAFSPLGGFLRYYKEVPPIPHAW